MTVIELLYITSFLFLLIVSVCLYAWLIFNVTLDFLKSKNFEFFILLSILIAVGVMVVTGICLDFKI